MFVIPETCFKCNNKNNDTHMCVHLNARERDDIFDLASPLNNATMMTSDDDYIGVIFKNVCLVVC